ncbi:MAG: hypothetical protein JOZ78_24400 [Chroococcidiopsidaceae cyanobacterium CP_BM_ER_R8_30]|nr:hypothetical protein [Chroococcidiopsidaceae cyanobacterium CP_BM_ER_R8_30]
MSVGNDVAPLFLDSTYLATGSCAFVPASVGTSDTIAERVLRYTSGCLYVWQIHPPVWLECLYWYFYTIDAC